MKKFCQVSNFTLRLVKLVIKLCSYFTSRLYFFVYQLFFKWKLIVSGVVSGKNCTVGSNTRFRITDGAKCVLGENVHFDRLSDITIKYGSLCVGNRVYFGIGLVVVARDKIKIGNDCLFAENVTIRDQDHRFGLGLITSEAGFVTSPIEIGDNVWIGAKATITKGVTIGSGSVIGANSVVTQNIPANSIAVGAPARVIRSM